MDDVAIEKTAMAMAWIERLRVTGANRDPGLWDYYDRHRVRLLGEARKFVREFERRRDALAALTRGRAGH